MAQRLIDAGIDVSKSQLDVALWPTRMVTQVSRDSTGLQDLIAWLTLHGVQRVGLEATAGYERVVMDTLEAAGFEIHRLNPLRVRRFAQAKGRIAKNDRADALTIAQFVAVMLDTPSVPRRRDLDPLVEHLTVRRHVIDAITACGNQLEHLKDARLRKTITAHQTALQRSLAGLDAKLAELVEQHDDWRDLSRRLRTVPGVGTGLAQTLIAWLPELGTCSGKAISCLAGLAPFDDDSGKRAGERHIKGGRSQIRDMLYMATLSAKRFNPVIAAFAKRLAAKKFKVVMVACMRKLLVMLNAMIRDGKDWQPTPA